nr:NADH dehydrogenase subunit 6 [Aphaenomurus interpositus]
MTLILSTSFLCSSHPIMMMIIIIAQTLTLCLMLWMFISMSWFSYIMFLIFLGGIMVLFIYISSLASNEKFKMEKKDIIKSMILMMFFIIFFIFSSNNQNTKINKIEFTETIFKLFSNLIMNMTLFSMIYLLITLVAVVKVTAFMKGPLRSST